jgi:hypothetical protein
MQWVLRALFFAIVLSASPLLTRADSPDKGADENQRLLEKWRSEPEHFARLCHDLNDFLALPAEQQEQLRRLDQDLHAQASADQSRLRRVLERYVDWLARLPDPDRRRIEAAESAQERLSIIKGLRERDWIHRLPQLTQAELGKLGPDKRQARIAELHREERARRNEWQTATLHWDELMQNRARLAGLKALEPEINAFITDSLWPLLTGAEKTRLQGAKGKEALYLQTLVELADKHPIRLPPSRKVGPVRFSELPFGVQTRFSDLKSNPPSFVTQAEGKWPDYAYAVARFAISNKQPIGRPLGPCRPRDFTPAVADFLEKRLRPVLSDQEDAELSRREGKWPGYANYILQMARKHNLPVPGMRLPGNPELWNRFRSQKSAKAIESLEPILETASD